MRTLPLALVTLMLCACGADVATSSVHIAKLREQETKVNQAKVEAIKQQLETALRQNEEPGRPATAELN